MVIFKVGKSCYVELNEPYKPWRRFRQSLGKIPERLAWLIANKMYDAYFNNELDPFRKGFSLMEWYRRGAVQKIIGIKEALDLFIVEKTGLLAPATIRTYKHYVTFWIETAGLQDRPISLITEADIKPVIMRPETSAKSKDSFKRHLSAFFTFCIEQHLVNQNPVKGIKLPKIRVSLYDKMSTDADIEQLYTSFDLLKQSQKQDPNWRKEWEMHWFKACVGLMRYAGLRRNEAITRKWSHYQKGMIFVEAQKGLVPRYIPVVPVLREMLDELKAKTNSEFMFINPKRPKTHITGDHVYRAFKMVCKFGNIDSKRTLHGLRHAFVTDLLHKGLSTAEVKVLAGHSTVAVTELYAHPVLDRIAAKMV